MDELAMPLVSEFKLHNYMEEAFSSRKLAEACERNVVFMALRADTHQHFTMIADFISQNQGYCHCRAIRPQGSSNPWKWKPQHKSTHHI